MNKLEVDITGMTCEHCAFSIENLLKKNTDVSQASVDYKSGKGKIVYDNGGTDKKMLVNTINSIGNYKVSGFQESLANQDSNSHYDLIIIGGGSAAFSAAIIAQENGLSTLMVNAGLPFGGTCVNVGCVPSKFLIRAGEEAHHASHSNFEGVQVKGAVIDFAKIIKEKNNLVTGLQQKKYLDIVKDFENFQMIEGWADFLDTRTLQVNGSDRYTALKFIIATGATTRIPDIEGLQDVGYLTNVSLFNLQEKPLSLTILGAGYIGLEIAMAYNRLGVKVRIIEFTDRVLRTQTDDISQELELHLRNEGIEILPNVRAFKFEKEENNTIIHCKDALGQEIKLNEPGHIVVATGTKPNTSKLALENIGIELTQSGHVAVNELLETNISNIYAVGDVANTPPYVYTAAAEGNIAVQNAFKSAGLKMDYSSLPWVVFTDPQIAGVGIDEVEAQRLGLPFEISKLPLTEVPRSLAAKDTRGFIKLIRNKETDKLIGARVVAPEGGELIMELTLAVKYGITVSDLAKTFHPYLTLSEGIKLAAIAFGKDIAKLSCCAS
ncbi:MAG TPA: mercury(II) reductase [Sphingobacteriaceae bacterium]|nr:mercury(II) reductase [Sphingobacteriaceae bacterium]